MTRVPADPAFATRLRPRLQESSRIAPGVMPACGAAVVLAFAVGVGVFRNGEPAVGRLSDLATATTTAEDTREPAGVAPREPSPPPPAIDAAHERPMVAADRSVESGYLPPAIVALPTPPVLESGTPAVRAAGSGAGGRVESADCAAFARRHRRGGRPEEVAPLNNPNQSWSALVEGSARVNRGTQCCVHLGCCLHSGSSCRASHRRRCCRPLRRTRYKRPRRLQ